MSIEHGPLSEPQLIATRGPGLSSKLLDPLTVVVKILRHSGDPLSLEAARNLCKISRLAYAYLFHEVYPTIRLLDATHCLVPLLLLVERGLVDPSRVRKLHVDISSSNTTTFEPALRLFFRSQILEYLELHGPADGAEFAGRPSPVIVSILTNWKICQQLLRKREI